MNSEINKTFQSILDLCYSFDRRLAKLEEHSHTHMQMKEKVAMEQKVTKLEERVSELEFLTNVLKDKYNSMCSPSLRREVYKCPVCDGNGRMKFKKDPVRDGSTYHIPDCAACKGEGIVWG